MLEKWNDERFQNAIFESVHYSNIPLFPYSNNPLGCFVKTVLSFHETSFPRGCEEKAEQPRSMLQVLQIAFLVQLLLDPRAVPYLISLRRSMRLSKTLGDERQTKTSRALLFFYGNTEKVSIGLWSNMGNAGCAPLKIGNLKPGDRNLGKME